MGYLCGVLIYYYTMIQLNNLIFGYDPKHEVFRDFSLKIEAGGIYGLLGQNGTGKSTLLYLVAGLLRPDAGTVLVEGMDPSERKPQLMQDLFIVPEEFELPSVPLQQYIRVIRPFYPRFSQEVLERCLEGFGMDSSINLGRLSMGQKKKAYVCVALATQTRILLMDEPTNGLDIESKSQFRKVVIGGMTDDKTILISTHQVHDVERMLDHVVIIDRNRVLLNKSLTDEPQAIDLEEMYIKAHHPS